MTIKKLVVGSMFSMLLGSEMAAADWDDVYYCQMTNLLKITVGGTTQKQTLGKFQFKLDQTKNAMVFGSKGYFKDSVLKLGNNWPDQEVWYAGGEHSRAYFSKGKFLFTDNDPAGVTAASADCDKF